MHSTIVLLHLLLATYMLASYENHMHAEIFVIAKPRTCIAIAIGSYSYIGSYRYSFRNIIYINIVLLYFEWKPSKLL